ncbi:rhomboid family intramembrane serine protease [Bacillota bacterium Lsc_1132]
MFTRTENFREFIRYYPIVSLIIAIHIGLYLLTVLPFFPNNWLVETFSGVNLYIMEGEVWRLITPTFLHTGFSHMLFNSFTLVLFGSALERMLGKGKFLVVYLISGFFANLATLLIEPLTYTHAGSSGAIFGLFGYYLSIILFRKHWLTKENAQIILTLTAISIIMTFVQPNINISAHLFGLLSGFLLGAAPSFNKRDFSNSVRDAANWAARRKQSFSRQSPFKIIFWGALILFTIIGFWARS